ncbi:MAG: DUF6873 family GME fold protein [Eubacteriales bacterium]
MGKYVLCGGKTSCKIQAKLKTLGYMPVPLPPYERLPEPVSSHPDMLIYRLNSGAILTYTGYYIENRSLFDRLGCEVITEDILPEKTYPRDIYMNALRLGDTVYGRIDMLSQYILNDSNKKVFIRQGYARCSACIIDCDALITADFCIASAASNNGAEVTLIENGNIKLEGYGYGFIGGASGQLDSGIAFFGDVMTHPSGKKITAAVLSRGMDVIKLDDGMLVDSGGLILI